MLLVARIDALGAVACEEVAVELQPRLAFKNRYAHLFGAAGIDRRFVHHHRAFAQRLADAFARTDERCQIRALVLIDRRGNRDYEYAAAFKLGKVG